MKKIIILIALAALTSGCDVGYFFALSYFSTNAGADCKGPC